MSSPEISDETTVNGIDPGDALRWTLTADGELRVSVVEQSYGALSELEPVDPGTETDAVELEREFGSQ